MRSSSASRRRAAGWPAARDFSRYQSVAGAVENDAVKRPVHVAITYAEDGTIRVFRDGLPYGKPYKTASRSRFRAGEAVILFGQRHTPAGGNRMLAGTIVRARLYDRALEPREIAASAATFGDYIPVERDHRGPAAANADGRASAAAGRDRAAADLAGRQSARVRRRAARGGSDARGDPGQPQSARRGGDGRRDRGDRRARRSISVWRPTPPRPGGASGWRPGSASRAIPLFARVVVNRLWQAHFGTGLVETPSDLGFNGGMPSHPELLDWLAGEIVARGWSLKAMHRLIVTSAALPAVVAIRPGRHQSRTPAIACSGSRPPVRLEAEMVRDAMLSVAGVLDPRLGGPSFLDQAVHKAPGTAAILYTSIDPERPGSNRRTLFRAWLAAAEATCSTPSTAPTHRPRRRGGPSRPRRSRPCR